MKRNRLLCCCLLLALLLTGCGGSEGASQDNSAYLGKYLCTGITMDGLAMNPQGKWLTLNRDGTVDFFLTEETGEAEWSLSGERLTLSVAGETVASGIFQGEELTLDMAGMAYTFLREGAQASQEESSAAYATFTCYGDLYAVRYPTERFHPDPAGLSDLYTDDGTKGWVTRLGSQEQVDQWLMGFDEKATAEGVTDYQSLDLTVAGYPARAVVYQDGTGWNSEVLVNFGQDMGSDTYPMYAAYLYFTGPTYLSVWSEEIQTIVGSLTLPQEKEGA